MLRASRIFAADSGFRSAREFAGAFRADPGGPLHVSQVSRWEAGKTAAEGAVLGRYEQLLGLPPDTLAFAREAAVRFSGEPVPYVSEHPLPTRAIHELLDKARVPGAMSSSEWRRLTGMVSTMPGLFLHPPELWREVAETLLNELVVAEHEAWFARQEAMSRLMQHPVGRDHAVRACIDLAEDRRSPVVIEPISLLDSVDHPAANRYVLEQLAAPQNDQALRGALLATMAKLRRGHYAAAQQLRLIHAAAELATIGDRTSGSLAGQLCEMLARPRLEATGPLSAEAVATGRRIALHAEAWLDRPASESDTVLGELISEALFSPNDDERLYAAGWIAASPLRTPVANAMLSFIKDARRENDDSALESGLRLLSRLRSTAHYPVVCAILRDRSVSVSARRSAAWALSHASGRIEQPTWRTIVQIQRSLCVARPSPLNEEILRGLVYSIGTDGHRQLLAELSTDPTLPPRVRGLAAWWGERTVVSAG
ncbi:hypothetical protein [Amycolatopsis tolypomycina]|uniref:hypothetical protein n=1 Tax=Amycolatopsis tolypomycina TaxID=208445 RepID=UPI0033B64A75